MNKSYKTRGIRGAVTVSENTSIAIKDSTLELLNIMIKENNIIKDDIASVIFTLTQDLTADFPAKFARIFLNWDDVPMICTQEIPVPNSLPMCIRVLIMINTLADKNDLKHIYLGKAKNLRPDLV